MNYHSTRNHLQITDSAQAVLNGLAPDGGLYVPQTLPKLDVQAVLKMDVYAMAAAIIGSFLPDIPNMELLVEKAYRDQDGWLKSSIINIAKSGKFSSDRTIQEYVDEIWHLDKLEM